MTSKTRVRSSVLSKAAFVALALLAGAGVADAQTAAVPAFVIGPKNTEDLVAPPSGKWIVGSGFKNMFRFGAEAQMVLIDPHTHAWSNFYPAEAPQARQDLKAYPDCPGPPDAKAFSAHGLSLRMRDSRRGVLYAVNHGGREAVEVFDIDFAPARPTIVWRGCVIAPEGGQGNSVAGLPGGGFVWTRMVNADAKMDDLFAGKPTGAVWEWTKPGGWRKIPGSELPGDNGVEVSADGKTIYVATTGAPSVVRLARNGDLSRRVTVSGLPFQPDNLRWAPDGGLLVAGQADEACSKNRQALSNPNAVCLRGLAVARLEPKTMTYKMIAVGPAREDFNRVSSALQLGKRLWLGSFDADRVAYFDLAPAP